jgi:hypothetical protein
MKVVRQIFQLQKIRKKEIVCLCDLIKKKKRDWLNNCFCNIYAGSEKWLGNLEESCFTSICFAFFPPLSLSVCVCVKRSSWFELDMVSRKMAFVTS